MLGRRFSSLATSSAWVRPGSRDYLKEILESKVYDVAVQTALVHAASLSKTLPNDCQLYLKREVFINHFFLKTRMLAKFLHHI
jgi:hypothetical protein